MSSASSARAADSDASTIDLIHGEHQNRGPLSAIDAERIHFAGSDSLPVDDAVAIRFAPPAGASYAKSDAVVYLVGDGRLPAKDAVLVDDACRITLAADRVLTVSLNDVAAIQWLASTDPAWMSALGKPSAEHDVVVARAAATATAIRAFVESITAEAVEFDWDKQTRTLPRSQVIGVVFARPADEAQKTKLLVQTQNGALIPAKQVRRLEDRAAFQCTLAGGSELVIPADQLDRIVIRTARVKYLSDMEPIETHERPIVALPRTWQADRNVLGEPLKAGSTTFPRGIGVQSGSSLMFDVPDIAEEFVAVLAIDSPSGVAGDCEFVVAADDHEVFRRRVKSGEEPVPLRVALSGARRLELRVDYGENLDFGDHANWCDAHLVLKPAAPDATAAGPP